MRRPPLTHSERDRLVEQIAASRAMLGQARRSLRDAGLTEAATDLELAQRRCTIAVRELHQAPTRPDWTADSDPTSHRHTGR